MSFELHEGEVLGVAGLQGHGQRELFMALFGAERAEGQVEVVGQAGDHPQPAAMRSRRRSAWRCCRRTGAIRACCSASPCARTSCSAPLKRIARARLRRSARRARSWSTTAVAQLQHQGRFHRAGRRHALAAATSRRWCWPSCSRPRRTILLFFDPTRGVDVGTKAEIFALMRDLAARGLCHPVLFDRPRRARQCRRPHAGDELWPHRRHP